MLEESPGNRITTSGLARQVGVSEAALYRHFPSKARMLEELIEFIEDTIFSRIHIILAEAQSAQDKCEQTVTLLLTFAERNPGITRLLTGDPLAGETDRLRNRVAQFFERLETQLRQILRESGLREGTSPQIDVNIAANLMLSVAEGRVSQFVRSDFSRLPTEDWSDEWAVLSRAIFPAPSMGAMPPGQATG